MATGMIRNVNALIGIRFMLGVVESAVMPSMLVFLSRWFTKSERSRANTFLILGNPATILWMSILSGYLIDSVGWRWMFILEGLPAIIWAFLWWRLVVDKPGDAKWLTDDEKNDLQAQLDIEQQSIKPGQKLCCSSAVPDSHFTLSAICSMVHWCVWICNVAAFYHKMPLLIRI